jgi:predicted nucleic acid-binding protein
MNQRIKVFDANIYSSYKNRLKPSDLEKLALSTVVFYELTATKIISKKRRLWDDYFRFHQNNQTLITPTEDDWRVCSQIIWQMHLNGENLPKTATVLQNDALICQSAISWHLENSTENPPCAIITENFKHFSLIADYLNRRLKKTEPKLVVVPAKNYF